MKIGIIGTGNMGATLGQIWASKGHQICYGVRDRTAPKVEALLRETRSAQAGSIMEAASFGEIIVLATPWDATLDIVASLGNVANKIIVDCTNPLLPGLAGLAVGTTSSGAEEIAKIVPQAKVIKCFSTTGDNNLTQVKYGNETIDTYICGDDQEAKAQVYQLAHDIGFEVVDCGPLKNARLLEPFALLWIDLAFKQNMGRNIAFKLLKTPSL